MLNHITLMGRLVRDPELRYTQNQTAVASFTLAVERDRKEPDGTKATDYIDCTAWKKTGEFISNYFSKGNMIVVTGRLQIRSWVGRDEKKRTAPDVVVDNAYFAENRRRSDPDERAPMPTDADAPPEFEETPPRDIDELMQNFPGAVEFVDPNQPLPWE